MANELFGVNPKTSSSEELEQIGSFILFMNDQIDGLTVNETGFSKEELSNQALSLGSHFILEAKMKRSRSNLNNLSDNIHTSRKADKFAKKTISDYFKK